MQRNVVAYDENQPRELEKATVIQDAISDLPAVLFFIYLLLFLFLFLNCKNEEYPSFILSVW